LPTEEHEQMEAGLEQALKNFRSSVHAWSDAAYGQTRTVVAVRHMSWRIAASWALGCVLAAGSVAGGFYERHHHQEIAKAAAETARQQKLNAAQRAPKDDEEDLLAKVDSDVSREVPSAMEPLAQMMTQDEAQ
jgi:hypothetical protein